MKYVIKHLILNLEVLLLIGLLVYSPYSIFSQDSLKSTNISEAPLFSAEDPLDITIKSDFKTLNKGKTKDPVYQAAELIYKSVEGEEQLFEIKIKARGITRKNTYCSFPPLTLNFKKKAVANTIFSGQDKLKIVAYCKNSDVNEQYNIQEYLIYKVYQLLTPYSFKVRLARFTYIDTSEKYKPVTRYGFIIEHEDAMAARNDGKITEVNLNNHDRCDRRSLDIFTVFQYMIGNTDWWVGNHHNVKLIQVGSRMPIPVPYDFDITGVVNTSYGNPDERLGISSVRERIFRGYCRMPGDYEDVFVIFNEKREAIYNLYKSCDLLAEKQLKGTLAYYEQFFDIINDPRQVRKNFYEACLLSHLHLY